MNINKGSSLMSKSPVTDAAGFEITYLNDIKKTVVDIVVARKIEIDFTAAQARILALEERLELWLVDDDGNKVMKTGIGDLDGIDCRNETIKQLDKRNVLYQKWEQAFLKITEAWEEHPDDWDWPCMCAGCRQSP